VGEARATTSSSRPTTGPAASSRTTIPPTTCATSTCRSCISCPARSASRAPSPAICWWSTCSTSAPLKESLWGFNGFFSKKNGGGFLTEHFPLAQKSIWDIPACYTSSRHVPGVNFAGLIHPGLIGCLPDPKMLATWNEREPR
jgi:hypothetical protein